MPPLHLGLSWAASSVERPIAAEVAEGNRTCLAQIQTKLLALDTVTAVLELDGATLAKARSASEHTINATWSKALIRDLGLCVSWTHEWCVFLKSCPLAVELRAPHSKTLRCLTQSKGSWCSPTIADARDDDPDGPAALESRGIIDVSNIHVWVMVWTCSYARPWPKLTSPTQVSRSDRNPDLDV